MIQVVTFFLGFIEGAILLICLWLYFSTAESSTTSSSTSDIEAPRLSSPVAAGCSAITTAGSSIPSPCTEYSDIELSPSSLPPKPLIYPRLIKIDFDITRHSTNLNLKNVRKLAAELCGRIHPHILIPIVSSRLQCAAKSEDTMKMRACLFSICTSLLVRGKDSYYHPGMTAIRKMINTILSWPSVDRNDVLKAQHGCIDCLAWMMCAELEEIALETSVSTFVIGVLTSEDSDSISSGLGKWSKESETTMHLHFFSAWLMFSSVLVRRFQSLARSHWLRKFSHLSFAFMGAGCNQVLFSVVYHLKSAVLPYSYDLLKVALGSLRDGSEKVRLGGARLLASLMASDEAIVHSISGGLLEARTVLRSISASDCSVEVRQLCQKLLAY
ncbi:hypothetical protein ACH5RR_007339 [Cinchona calisaya]|uniref:ARM repeat superfamily protein n=1 Tax=Cinchona calisaya TaxID=153742 RepID=A0ABD3ARM5_9GENT